MASLVIGILDGFIEYIRGDNPRKRSNFDKGLRRRLSRRQKGKCIYCRNQFKANGRNFTIDHIVPVSAGGGDEESNLQALCRTCNQLKSDHTDEEFRERINVGRMKLAATRQRLSRTLLKRIIKETDMHEGARRRRTARFRMRLTRLVSFWLILTISALTALWVWRSYPEQWEATFVGLSVFYLVLLMVTVARAKKKGYIRWNPGRR